MYELFIFQPAFSFVLKRRTEIPLGRHICRTFTFCNQRANIFQII